MSLSLSQRIKGERKKIQRLWFQEVLEIYPKQSRSLIGGVADRFSNPIGFTLSEGIEEIFSVLVGEKSLAEIDPALERLIKLRALQEADQAGPLGFLFSLKKIVRKSCGAYSSQFTEFGELLELEDRIDGIIRKAHGIYVQAREKILQLQVNEMKNKTYMFRKLADKL